jgi:hypothetical protein
MNIMTAVVVKHAQVLVDTTVNRLMVLVGMLHQRLCLLVLLVCTPLRVSRLYLVDVLTSVLF